VICCLLLSPIVFSYSTVKRASVCNGNAELCSRSYGNVSFVGAHDSYAVGFTNLAANQDYNVTQQLTDGVRLLQNQALNNSGTIELCHTNCLLYDGGTLENYLTTVKTWMDVNTQDVVTILLVNIDDQPAALFGQVFQSVGLDQIAYVPENNTVPFNQWPTLGEMIDSGKRLVVFMDFEANDTNYPYIIPEFLNVWETAFDVTDPSFSCAVNRTQGDASQQMYLINHFLDSNQEILGSIGSLAPDKGALNVTNAASGPGSLGQQASDCTSEYGRPPNFLLVDFYEYGNGSVFDVAASLNGIPAPTNVIAQVPANNGASSPSPGSGSAQALISPHGGAAFSIAFIVSLLSASFMLI